MAPHRREPRRDRATAERDSQVPSSEDLGRHEQEQHGRPWREQPPGDEPDEEPPGWWQSMRKELGDRGIDLARPVTWSWPVCRSPDRVAIGTALGLHAALVSLWGKYGIDRGTLRAHRRHMVKSDCWEENRVTRAVHSLSRGSRGQPVLDSGLPPRVLWLADEQDRLDW
jgi:hypothetical protein